MKIKKTKKLYPIKYIENSGLTLQECVGILLRKLRIEKGLSGEELAFYVGLSQQQISRYERAESEMTLGQLQMFSEALGMSIWKFMDILRLLLDSEVYENKKSKQHLSSS
ncbi:MAG TPA: XRE family transcriptional regulator [Morganella sp. (in: Bacteria)]|nr:helix-turn-helix transcriptional regulator [Morganella morganii]HCM61189.1 XRE family transcriptional regulator [Morganella sp. (in: enterobacteria)]